MRLLLLSGMLAVIGILAPSEGFCATPIDVTPYVKRDGFEGIKLSPNGEYYAATVPMEGKSVLLVVRRADNKPTAGFSLAKNHYVGDFDWVSPTRLMISMMRKFGALDEPQYDGNLYAINADGTGSALLIGQDVQEMSTGSHIQGRKQEHVAAFLVDGLQADDRSALVSVMPFDARAFSRVERMDVHTGKRTTVARAPVRNARFLADHEGEVRFAMGVDTSNTDRLYYRAAGNAEWQEINNAQASGHSEWPLGFSADDRLAYIQVEQSSGADAIIAMDTTDNSRKEVFRDATRDPDRVLYAGDVPIGVALRDGKQRSVFFDPDGTDARLYRSLEAAFPGAGVRITSGTTDGKTVLVEVSSDRNPGDFYLFDTVAKKAAHLVSRRDWFDPDAMAIARPFNFKARDGMTLYGYLTAPKGSAKNLPMVVLPHGGPFGRSDSWSFDPESQMLAAAGYAVLQVNFRGSGNHGGAYEKAGAREWGGKMQDDVTDATRWAINEGIADGNRVCIYGASYGAYASLMGAAREPGLYKCAAGYVGVYDLQMMFSKGDIRGMDYGKAYLRDWIGDVSKLGAVSPVNLAGQIKAPIFLAAGGEDERAPMAHTEKMEKALRAAGVPVETLYYRTEGHGFYVEAHKKEFYQKLLSFFDRNIGAVAGATASGAGK